ncbi:MAG: PAS domain S-box protein, partial [candidate division Zixibacteria bacterium]|nr:PAS domain S-box protein [candidate division Zixibacteria bacterium]
MRVDKTYPGAEITELDGENPQLNPSELSERLKFEILLSDLAVAFIQIPITEIDYEINDWLKRVSEFFACDIIRLFEQFPIDNSMNLIYTYSKPGVDPPAYNSSINYPWVAAQILEGNPCILHSLEDIPEDAIDDRNSFIDRGLKSIIGVPLISGDNVIGGLSIVTVIKERQWTSIEIERVQRIGNVFANIIVRKQSDNVLRDSEEKYHSLVSHIPDVTWSTDINGTTHFISHNIEKIYGYSPAEIYESGEELWFGRIHPEDIDAVRQTFKDIFENNLLLDIEYRIQRKDGRWIWLHDRSTGTYQRNGILYADGVCTDITERKQVEETLRGYEHIVSSSKDMLALLDRNFVYLATNEAYAKAFGKTHGELIGATVSDIFGDTFFETVIRPNAEKCLQGLEVRYQNWFDYPTIGKRYMEITYDPYRGSDNEIKGFVVNGRDITERKRAEEALLSEKLLSEEYINSLPGLFYVFDEQRFVKWNSSEWRRITGYSDEELAGKYGTDFFEGDDKKHIAERMQK